MEENKYYLSLVKVIYEIAKKYICDRLSEIDYNKKLFSIDEKVEENGEPYFVVRYENKTYLMIKPYRKNYKDQDGFIHCRGQVTIKRKNDAAWYNEEYKAVFVWVNEFQNWDVGQKSYNTDAFLKHFLPVGDKQEIETIKKDLADLGVSNKVVKFDTMSQRYVLNIDFADYLNSPPKEDKEALYLCKYMSLDTFLCIVENKNIRLNSVVSMNDSSEGFFLGDLLCDAYDDIRRKNTDFEFYQAYPNALRYKRLIEYKNKLIMSLTKRIDDALMWRLYGDNGRGVCLCFQVPSHIVKPIIYISENDEKFRSLKNVVAKWQEKHIHVVFAGIEDYMFVTKSSQFKYEDEFRILKTCEEKKLKIAKYGNLVSFYNDYDFKELGIKPSSLYIGSNLPNWDVNYPMLVDMAHRYLGITEINNSGVDKLRI